MIELKRQLKYLQVSYSDLARTLDVPESTLKKWFNTEDGSFNRITLICEALGIPLGILLKSIEDQNIKTFTFTKEQQTLFSANRKVFDVYWLLVYERKEPSEINEYLKIGPTEMKNILLKLDKVRLLKFGENDKVKIPNMRPIQWDFQGNFMKSLKSEWTERILKDPSRIVIQFFQLTSKSIEELDRDLLALEEKYARRTIIELSDVTKKRKQVRYLSAQALNSFIE